MGSSRRGLRLGALAVSIAAAGLVSLAATPQQRGQQNSSAGGLICDAGGPYIGECSGGRASVRLDGTGSQGLPGAGLRTKWLVECQGAWLDDPFSPTPTLTLDMTGTCGGSCGRVDLKILSKGHKAICGASVLFVDSQPPVLSCPPDTTAEPDETEPPTTGFATATDACNTAPSVTWSDVSPDPQTILRTWSADDGCLTSSCVQTISIQSEPHVDIKPGSCPNEFVIPRSGRNLTQGGPNKMTAAVLGNDFDVTQVDLGTVGMTPINFLDGVTIAPVTITFGDPGTPFIPPNPCDCAALGGDGLTDLVLEFSIPEMITQFGLGALPTGTLVELEIDGFLLDGTYFRGTDCILIFN